MYEIFLIVIVFISQEEEAALTRAELSEKVMITDLEFHRTIYYSPTLYPILRLHRKC